VFRVLLHPFVLAILVTLLIWFAVIAYWQETVRLVSAEDVGIYLIGLPLAVVAFGFLLRAVYRRRAAKAVDTPAVAPAPCVAATDERERSFTLALLAIGLASGAGQAAADAYQALKAKSIQPAPDSELRNRDGFPVHACRVKDLATDDITAALEALDPGPIGEGVRRALALLDQALVPAFEIIAGAAPKPDAKARKEASPPMARLAVDLLLPAGWDERARALAARHVGHRLGETGWPAEATTFNMLAANDGDMALKRLDAFCLRAGRAESGDLYLLAGCDSAIDDDQVAALEASGRLFATAQPQGRIPGEAATAVLAGNAQKVVPDAVPLALLGRVAFAERSKSADAAGRIGHETLLDAAQNGVTVAAVPAADIGLVVSDADQRASRNGECLATLTNLLPELDPATQFVGVGQSLGQLGAAGVSVALCIAAGAVAAEEKPVLLMTACHPTERAAVVLRPWVEPEAKAAVS